MNQSIRVVSGGLLCLFFSYVCSAQQTNSNNKTGGQSFDSLLNAGKAINRLIPKVNLFDSAPKLTVKNAQADFQYNYLHDTSGLATGLLQTMYATTTYNISADMLLWQLPFHLQVKATNGLYTVDQPPFNTLPSANFNHQQYLQNIQKNVLDKVKPEQLMSSQMAKINNVKAKYEQLLHKDINKVQQDLLDNYHTTVPIPDKVTDLSQSDMVSLKNKLIPSEQVAAYQKNTELYRQLNESDRHDAASDSMRTTTLKEIKKYEALEKMYGKIAGAKSRFENNEQVKQMRAQLPFQSSDYKTYLKNPAQLSEVVKTHTSLSAVQSMFMHVTKLDLGTNPLSGGQFNFNQIMNTGLNTEYTSKKSSIGAVYGSGTGNQNRLLEAGLDGFVTNQYSKMGGVKLGSGWNSRIKQSVSFNLFSFSSLANSAEKNPFNMQAGNVSSPDRQDAVITYQSAFNIAANHALSVDVSQSFGSYKNTVTESGAADRKDVAGGVFSGEGMSNYAIGVDYEGTIAETEVQAYIKKAGAGYNNPGNVFVRKGESRAGLGINRKLLNQRLTLKYKTDYRVQNFDPAKNYSFSNFANQLQVAWRQNRNNRFGLAFRDNSYAFTNKAAGMHTTGYTYNVQADAGYLVKIKRTRINSTLLISRQNLEMPVVTGELYQSHAWLINHTSSVLLKKNLLTATVSINRSDNKDYLFNTSFINSEVSYSYSLFNGIRASSGTGYYINTGWNRQLGVRQQVGGQVWEKVMFDIEISCKKAVQKTRQQLADQFFMNASISYKF